MQISKIVTGVVTKKPKLRVQQDGLPEVYFWVAEDYFDEQRESKKNYYLCCYTFESSSFIANFSENITISVEGHFEIQSPSQYKYQGYLKNIVILPE